MKGIEEAVPLTHPNLCNLWIDPKSIRCHFYIEANGPNGDKLGMTGGRKGQYGDSRE